MSVLRTLLQHHVKEPIDTTSLIHDCLLFGSGNNRLNIHAVVQITQNQKRPATATGVSTLKSLLLQYSLYRFIAYSISHTAAP